MGVSVRFVLLFVDYTCSSHARILPNHLEHWLEEQLARRRVHDVGRFKVMAMSIVLP